MGAAPPERVCEVAYDHLQGDRFRHGTTFQRWRPDKPPADCRYDQLEVDAARSSLRGSSPRAVAGRGGRAGGGRRPSGKTRRRIAVRGACRDHRSAALRARPPSRSSRVRRAGGTSHERETSTRRAAPRVRRAQHLESVRADRCQLRPLPSRHAGRSRGRAPPAGGALGLRHVAQVDADAVPRVGERPRIPSTRTSAGSSARRGGRVALLPALEAGQRVVLLRRARDLDDRDRAARRPVGVGLVPRELRSRPRPRGRSGAPSRRAPSRARLRPRACCSRRRRRRCRDGWTRGGSPSCLRVVRRPRRVALALGLVPRARARAARRASRGASSIAGGGVAALGDERRHGRQREVGGVDVGHLVPAERASTRARRASAARSTPTRRCGPSRSGCSRGRRRGAPPSTTCWSRARAPAPRRRAPAPAPRGAPRRTSSAARCAR